VTHVRRITAEAFGTAFLLAVTLARSASDTFAGIRPEDTPGFIPAQLAGAAAATVLFRWLLPSLPKDAASVVLSHSSETGGNV
jgi:glycerol uptake facilitator-like aquaporin